MKANETPNVIHSTIIEHLSMSRTCAKKTNKNPKDTVVAFVLSVEVILKLNYVSISALCDPCSFCQKYIFRQNEIDF